MAFLDKINIYISQDIRDRLDRDAVLFEIFKKDRKTINRNLFLTKVLCGYYNEYLQECIEYQNIIRIALSCSSLTVPEQEASAKRVTDRIFACKTPESSGGKTVSLPFKPTQKSEWIIEDLRSRPFEVGSPSQFFRAMLVRYINKPIFARERIVFMDQVEKIETACEKSRSISFSLIWDKSQRHEVIPYAIVPSQEEIYNYLVCEELNDKTGRAEVRSYRINRIANTNIGTRSQQISNENRNNCERTVHIAPQYAINNDVEICVRLNAAGEKLYNRIYYGRPRYERIEPLADGLGKNYFFRCSTEQVYHYFRRFDNNTAVILYPPYLRQRMISFHKNVLVAYEMAGGINNV